MWLCAPLQVVFDLAQVWYPNYVVLVLGNEGGGPHHIQGCHTRGLEVLTLNIHQISN